jgi:hypothetical protein
MLIARDKYISEELAMIIKTLEESLNKCWNTKLLRKFIEGDYSVMNGLHQELLKLEIFPYLTSANLTDVAIINEVLGTKLLPGILASTIVATRSINDKEILEGIYKGKIKVAISDSNMVPAADLADLIIIGKNFAWKEEVVLTSYESIDNSMRISKVEFKKSQPIEFNEEIAMLNLASQMVGGAEAVLNLSVEYAKNRIAFGKPIGSFQAVKHKLVDDAMIIELARSLCLKASQNIKFAPLAKYYSNKKLLKVMIDGIQVHGGIGFTDDVDVHLYFKRLITLGKLYYNYKPNILNFL